MVRRLKAKMMHEMQKWENREGVAFLKRVGVKDGDTVADFGARVGHYAIPAARLVGAKGRVYALDKDPKALRDLRRKKEIQSLDNIMIVETAGEINLSLSDESVDIFILYDILHMMPVASRRAIYGEATRVLKDSGLLSVYPKHVADDEAAHHFENLTSKDVGREICSVGFTLRDKVCGVLSHDDTLVSGCVWNFTKKEKV